MASCYFVANFRNFMSEESKQNGRNGRTGDIKVPPRNWLLWILILGSIPLLMIFHGRSESKYTIISRQDLIKVVDKKQMVEGTGTIHYNPQSSVIYEITGKFKTPETGAIVQFKAKTRLNDDLEKKLLDAGFETVEPNTFLLNLFVTILPILFVAFLIYFFFIRQIKMAGKGALSFGKSKARMLNKERNRTTF